MSSSLSKLFAAADNPRTKEQSRLRTPLTLQTLWPALGAAALFIAVNLPLLFTGLPGEQTARLVFPDARTQQTAARDMAALPNGLNAEDSGKFVPVSSSYKFGAHDYALHLARRFLIQTVWPDEAQIIRALLRVRPAEGRFNPHFYQYGSGAVYLMGASMKAGQWLGLYQNPGNLAVMMSDAKNLQRLWAMPRVLSLLCAAAAIVVIYLTVLPLWGLSSAVLAAFLLACAPAIILDLHYLKPYIQSVLAVSAIFYFLSKEGTKNLYFAAICAGLATMILPTNGMFAVLVCLAAWARERRWQTALLCALCAFAAFAVTDPWWFTSPREAIDEFRAVMSIPKQPPDAIDRLPYLIKAPVVLVTLIWQTGAGYLAVFALGAAAWLKKRGSFAGLCLAMCGLAALYLPLMRGAHYLLPLLPALILLGVYGLSAIPAGRLKTALITLLVIWNTAGADFYLFTLNGFENKRMQAGAWINKNIAAGSSIGTNETIAPGGFYPPFAVLNYTCMVFGPNGAGTGLEADENNLPDYYIDTGKLHQDYAMPELRHYKKEAEFRVTTHLDRLFKNTVFADISQPLSIYKKASE